MQQKLRIDVRLLDGDATVIQTVEFTSTNVLYDTETACTLLRNAMRAMREPKTEAISGYPDDQGA